MSYEDLVKRGVQQELARGVGKELSLQQCEKGYIKLPMVPKKLYRGPRGGLFYMNQKNNRVYLNAPQKNRMAQNRLPGVLDPPGRNPVFSEADVLSTVFARVNRQIRAAGGVI